MSQYYQTTQGSTQYQLADIIAQGSSQTITDYYNIQYIPAENSIETQSTVTRYRKNGTDISNISCVYYKDMTSTKTLEVGNYNKCMIVACSGGGGGGGGGGAGYRYNPPNSDTKSGGSGGDGGKGVVAVYGGIDINDYSNITVSFTVASGLSIGGNGGTSTNAQGNSDSGDSGNSGSIGSSISITCKQSANSGNTTVIKCTGGNGGQGGQGGGNSSNGGNGANGNTGTLTSNLSVAQAAYGALYDTFSSLQVDGNTLVAGGTRSGQSGNGGAGDGSKGGSGEDGNDGSGAFARIYFYK